MANDLIAKLGPLGALAGTWEGQKGTDIAPSADRKTATSSYKETIVFEPFGPTDNHEQHLYGLRYALTAWRTGAADPFHEDRGYYLWDPASKQVMRGSSIPRGMVFLAGGTSEPNAREFKIAADVGSETYGICSNPFLDKEFKTVRFEMTVTLNSDGTMTYKQDSQLKVKGQKEIFHHTDTNTLTKVR